MYQMTSNAVHRDSLFLTLIHSLTMTKIKQAKFILCLAAFLSFLLSVSLWFKGQKDEGMFVGIWVPSILSFGTILFANKG